ncbi:hypothetical protein D7B24_008362 [Verticillium nonalfalfae]|uniref:Uncharacterized protein n=1 Tax=Verticillium nonalfalfae TaxID=1051616 RepID=A0A3M9Y564_9PEZI|nr:uncharacterized protein D7B24_008362 [Verticillium nonalfalfae]RNJ55577.1 hypothetical protein D7B24_008362 [Verticillium nonalfalfae]
MPTRPTARCCRAVKHLRAPLDNVWITDSVLASAFERYCHASRLSRRNSSSVPGPLENRKRLGKRRITGLYSADFQPTLPPWLIEFPADLTQWKWSPPTELASRLRMEESPPPKSWSLLTWMDQLLPAEEAVDYPRQEYDDVLQPSDDFSERLEETREALLKSLAKLDPDFRLAMDRLQHDIYLGLLTLEAIPKALSSFTATIVAARQDPQVARSATTALLSAIIKGMAYSRVQGLAEASPHLCNTLLRRVSELPASRASAELICTILTVVPDQHMNRLGEGLHAALQTWLAAPARAYEASAPLMANALARISPQEHTALLAGMESVAMRHEGSHIVHGRRLRWLDILARMPQVDTTFLLEACSRSSMFGQASSSAPAHDLSKLLLQQWQSRGYLRNARQVQSAWKREASTDQELSMSSLAWHIGTLEHPGDGGSHRIGLLMSLFRALRRLDMIDGFLASFDKYCRTRQSSNSNSLSEVGFRAIALASKDHRIATAMYELMKRHRGTNRPAALRTWSWNDWHPYIKPMILDADVDPNLVWEVLHSESPAERARRHHHQQNTTTTTNMMRSKRSAELRLRTKQKLVADMAVWFSRASHLSDRAALRHVSRCNAWLAAQGLTLPAAGLEAVVRVAVRDLKRGEPGRTARLNWALDLTQRRLGVEQAEKTGRVLEMWRRRNADLGRP